MNNFIEQNDILENICMMEYVCDRVIQIGVDSIHAVIHSSMLYFHRKGKQQKQCQRQSSNTHTHTPIFSMPIVLLYISL